VTPATGALSRGRVKRERRPPNRGINIARGGPSRVRIPNSMSEGRERRRKGGNRVRLARDPRTLSIRSTPGTQRGVDTRESGAKSKGALSLPLLCFRYDIILYEGRGRLYCFTPSCRRPSPLFYSSTDFIIYRALAHGKSSDSMQIIRLSRIEKSRELF